MTITLDKKRNKIIITGRLVDISIIPYEKYISDILNSEKLNLWELHEIKEEQNISIEIAFNKNIEIESIEP